MIEHPSDMALAFLQYQPISAARILEQQPIEEVAEFIAEVPYTQAAIVLKKMLPQHTARLCSYLEPATSAAFLSQMDAHLVSAIMRHTHKPLSRKLLDHLPERMKLRCRLLLNYPETSVGAWMSTDFLSLAGDCDVQEALHRLSLDESTVNTNAIFIVDRDRKLQGIVSVSQLLRLPSKTAIKAVMQAQTDVVSGRASLASIINSPIWSRSEYAAVINEKRQMIGLLRHLDLRHGLKELSTTIRDPVDDNPIGAVWDVYGKSLLALLNTVGDAVNTKEA
ncbi:magnesium transporter MgtE N-terminal domain-containing protein [Litoribrevibacter euphylliae]|uniref:Magnesium transporter MgtE N-terminal domain-containing protein n=1 Tax=Litoribrevibacter euphylliae TaxID=1834034 RepID=A0ABV7HFJ4_9GAMM